MYVYAARQPILDTDKKLFAYELLFRESLDNVFPDADEEKATSQVIEASQFNDEFRDLTEGHPAFINFTLNTLSKKFHSLIPPEKLVVEILETERPGKRLLAETKALKEAGYTVALDDYEHENVWLHFFPFVDIIKVDFRASNHEQILTIKKAAEKFPNIKLLAEKIETHEEFDQAKELGFDYFQGYFFAEPEVMQSKALSPSQMTLAELLYEVSKPDLDLQGISSVFERDVSLSYKLLRYSNSAAFKRRAEISTIRQALVVLGHTELKKFLSLQFATQLSDNKPEELMRLSMTRAKFCEDIAIQHGKIRDTASAFLTGMMSLIDAILDEPIQSIMDKLPLSDEIKTALIKGEGELAEYLQLVKHYEKGEWDMSESICQALGMDQANVPDYYHDAIVWASEQLDAIQD